MKLTIGWWKARDGSKWHVDWCCDRGGVGHRDDENQGAAWNRDGVCVVGPDYKSDLDLIAPWSEPKLRPWKPEEVPLGAQRRHKDTKLRLLITSDGNEEAIKQWFQYCEHSTDGGKTWKPCGVEE